MPLYCVGPRGLDPPETRIQKLMSRKFSFTSIAFFPLSLQKSKSSGNSHLQPKFLVPPLTPQVHKDKAVIYLVYIFENGVPKVHLADRLSIPHSKASQWESNNCFFSNFTK